MGWLGEHWLTLFGWAGSVLLVVSLLQTRVLRFRLLNLCACVSLATFNAFVGVWPMVGMNIATSLINVFFLVKLLREEHDPAVFEVLELSLADSYLSHFLRVHHDDVHGHFPAFEGLESADLAIAVLRGDETVGVVIVAADSEDPSVCQVLVDYVTPRFRDFSPGEFVWRNNPLLLAHGFRSVRTPPDMLAPYYPRLGLGFRPVDSHYELDLTA